MLKSYIDDRVEQGVRRNLEQERILERLATLERVKADDKVHSRFLRDRALELLRMLRPQDIVGDGRMVRIGHDVDGGYVMAQAAMDGAIAYSFGIGGDVSWDLDMAGRGFEVFMHDHTIKALPEQHERFRFVPVGISGGRPQANTRRLAEIIQANGHTGRRDMVLKIDVEGAEWEVFSDAEPETLDHFSQIVVEFHSLDQLQRDDLFRRMKASLEKLAAAFAPVHVHGNNFSQLAIIGGIPVPQVLEVTYLRRAGFGFMTSSKLFPTELDFPNLPTRPDLHLGSFRFSD